MPGDDERTVDAGGREVRVSRPDKIYFPALDATKFDLVSYYLDVADHLLNTAGGRPAEADRAGRHALDPKPAPVVAGHVLLGPWAPQDHDAIGGVLGGLDPPEQQKPLGGHIIRPGT